MEQVVSELKSFCQKTILQLKEDLKSIRTGRASPALIEGLIVEAYGGSTKLKLMELSTITTEGPGTLVVIPFDPSTLSDIEKAILKSNLGVSPQVQGTRIMVKIPALSQEQREKMFKIIGQMVEERKGMIRNERDNSRRKIKQMTEDKTITEDQKYRSEKDIDTVTHQYTDEIQTIKDNKETEIMQI